MCAADAGVLWGEHYIYGGSMEKKKILGIALMIVFCVLMWGIFFMLGIKTIGAVLRSEEHTSELQSQR